MAESPSSNQTIAETGDGAVADPSTNGAPALEVVLTEDGVPVVDLRTATADDAALVVVDGELMLRLADGTEWPVDVSSAAGNVVLQVAEEGFIAARSVQAALTDSGATLPLASLAQGAAAADGTTDAASGETVVDTAGAVEPAADNDNDTDGDGDGESAGEAPGGGASFRAFEIGDIGQGLDPLLALGRTAAGVASSPNGDLDTLDANAPGNGSRFVNLAPIAGDDLATTSERQSIDIDVLANDRDPNSGDQLTVVGVEAEGLSGVVTLGADGTITYDPDGQFTHLGVGETATETFGYTVADQHGKASTATVTVEITGVNDAPDAIDDRVAITEKAAVAIDVLANDVDPDANDVLEVVGAEATGVLGSLGFLGDGQFVYDPNGQFDYLGKGQTATETFRYAVSDQHGATDIASVEILIEGVNDAPIAHDDFVVVSEKGEVRFDALANDVDPDQGDTIRVTNLFSLGNSAGQRWVNHDGTVTYRPYGAYDHLGEGEVAHQQFGYTVSDQHGAIDTGVVTVAVVGVNDAPVANDDKARTDQNTAIELDLLVNDFDPDRNDTIQLFAADPTGVQGQLSLSPTGKLIYDPNGQFDHLAEGQTAEETFQYAITDQHGAIDIATVEVAIHGVNDAPTAITDVFTGFTTIGLYAPIETLLANDFDIDDGDTIHFAGLGNAVNGDVEVTPDGYFVFTPTPGYTGPAGFQYAIQDQHGATDIGDVMLDIRDIEPGDVSFEVLTSFGALQDALVTEHPDGGMTIDMLFDVGAVAGASMLLGDMPYFTAILSGEMQGVMQVTFNADGTAQATGDIVGDLSLEAIESPIFQPLGGDTFDALFGPSTSPLNDGLPTTLHTGGPNSALADLLLGEMEELGLLGQPTTALGGAIAGANAEAYGDGTFFLEIGGLLDGGAALFDDETGEALFVAELLGEFAAFAAIDIRDAIDIAADGFVETSFDTEAAPLAFAASGSSDQTGGIVIEEQALAA